MAGYDSYVLSMLHFEGMPDNTATPIAVFINDFRIWTNDSTTAMIDTAQKKFGNSSLLLDGNSDYIRTYSAVATSDFLFGTVDWTWEAQIRFASTGAVMQIMGLADSDASDCNSFYWDNSTNRLYFYAKVGGVAKADYYCSWTPSSDTWYHVAVARSGTTLYMFIDGISKVLTETTAISTNDITPAGSLYFTIGREGVRNARYFNGWIDEVRVSRGIARWTGDFTAPTEAYSFGAVGTTMYDWDVGEMMALRPLPFWIQRDSTSLAATAANTYYFSIDVSGSISGVVKRDGVVLANARVFLCYRQQANFMVIGTTVSAADGTYSFDPNSLDDLKNPIIGLDQSNNNYFVYAVDPQDSYNAKIYDLITPV